MESNRPLSHGNNRLLLILILISGFFLFAMCPDGSSEFYSSAVLFTFKLLIRSKWIHGRFYPWPMHALH